MIFGSGGGAHAAIANARNGVQSFDFVSTRNFCRAILQGAEQSVSGFFEPHDFMAKRKKRGLLRIERAKIPWFSFARIIVLAVLGVALAIWGAARAWHFHNEPMFVPRVAPTSSEAWPPPSTIEIDLSNEAPPDPIPKSAPSTSGSGAR
jgi:hypothetical protein